LLLQRLAEVPKAQRTQLFLQCLLVHCVSYW
jgi:hypothetical protein